MMRKGYLAGILGFCVAVTAPVLFAGEHSIPANAPVVPWTRFSIQYTVNDIGNVGPEKVEFYMTTDMGKTWELYGADPDAKSPMMVTVPGDGIYGFMTVGTDHVGNRERAPAPGTRPETVIIVDRTPPVAKWISPTQTTLLPAGGIELAWEATDDHLAAAPVSIEYSTDGGSSWLPLRDRQAAVGKYVWKPSADIGGSIQFRMIVRDRAGNRLIIGCKNRILTDNIPPTVGLTGPTSSGDLTVDLTYAAADNKGGSGLNRVTLYYSSDNGEKWFRYGDDNDLTSPFRFTSPVSGPVGLVLVATDRAGNRSPLPRAGYPATFTITLDNESPQVTFNPQLPDNRSTLRGGETVVLRWNAVDANIQENSGALEFSPDSGSTWEPIASGLPVNGPYKWQVPLIESRECLVRVTVSDVLKNTGSATSLRFNIDSREPITTIRDVEPGNLGDQQPPTVGSTPRARYDIGQEASDTGSLPERYVTPPIPTTDTEVAGVLPETKRGVPINRTGLPVPPPTPAVVPTPPVTATTTDTTGGVDSTGSTGMEWASPPDAGQTPPVPTPVPVPPKGTDDINRVTPTPIPVVPTTSSEPDKDLAEAESLFNAGRIDQSLAKVTQAVNGAPDNAMAYDLLARIYYEKRDFTRAVGYAAKAIKLNQNEPAHWHNLGEAAYSQARQVARTVAMKKRSGDSPPPQEIMDLTTQRDKAITLARKSFNRVTLLAPQEKKGWDRLGDTIYMHARFLAATQPDTAAQFYREAITAYSKAHSIAQPTYRETFQLGVSHYRLSDISSDRTLLSKAQALLERAIEDAGDDTQPREAFWYLAEIHQKLGNTKQAAGYWEQVMDCYDANSPKERKFHLEAQERLRQLKESM